MWWMLIRGAERTETKAGLDGGGRRSRMNRMASAERLLCYRGPGTLTSCGSRPSDFRSSHNCAGMSMFIKLQLDSTSATHFPPGMTVVTAGWPRGN